MKLTPVEGATPRYDDDGNELVAVATCGTCGRSWNDAAVSDITPVPAGRCPFEAEHEYEDDPDEDGFVPCPVCGVNRVDPEYTGADGRSVCDDCRDEDEDAESRPATVGIRHRAGGLGWTTESPLWEPSVDVQEERRPTDEQVRALAREQYGCDEIEIDTEAVVSRDHHTHGAFVAAWVWVMFEKGGTDDDD